MSRLTKFLDQFGEQILNESGSKSIYYKIKDKKIRISNHLPEHTELNKLYIFIPKSDKNKYIIVLARQLYIYNSFTTLKEFLKSWIIIEDLKFSLEVDKTNERLIRFKKEISCKDKKISELEKRLKNNSEVVDINLDKCSKSIFTKSQLKQIAGFKSQINSFIKQSKVK